MVLPLARLPGIDRMLALLVSGLIGDLLRRLGLEEPDPVEAVAERPSTRAGL
ncbi:hypothetical protein [Bosea sp. LjRoot237]|uniref:hypothetical protein n=1 Tax=Bosea sp. LjRoot237 TaxID=3342292 RepID=UPI003ED16DFD